MIRDTTKQKNKRDCYLSKCTMARRGRMNEWMDEWMGSKESIVHNKYIIMGMKQFFLFTCYYIISFLYILKTKANSSQSTSWCPLKMSLSRITFSDAMLQNRVYLTSTVSTSRANRSNVTSIHQSNSNIRRSVVSVIIMRMDEELRHTSVAS